MKRWGQVLIMLASILLITGTTMCSVGISAAESRVPAEQRAKMEDTDWIGSEWAVRAVVLDSVALVFGIVGGTLLLVHRRRTMRMIGNPS